MKKTILLALLAGSMLASCASAAAVNVQENVVDPLAGIVEDTEIHDEIFCGANSLIGGPKRLQTAGDIGLGIQHLQTGDTMAIRFIAAVKTADISKASASWTRVAYDAEGNIAKASGTINVTKAYTTINDGSGDPLTIAAYKTATGGDYTHFVVYSVYNIPVSTAGNFFVNAYLTFDDDTTDGEAAVPSKVIATTVDQATQFTFGLSDLNDDYFAVKKSSTGCYTISADDSTDNPEGNYASFTTDDDRTFASGDSLFVVSTLDNKFLVYDSLNATRLFCSDSGAGIAFTAGADCNIYFMKNNKAQIVATRVEATITFNDFGGGGGNPTDANAVLDIWAWGGGAGSGTYYLSSVNTTNHSIKVMLPIDITGFKVIRYNPDSGSLPTAGSTVYINEGIWNATGDQSANLSESITFIIGF